MKNTVNSFAIAFASLAAMNAHAEMKVTAQISPAAFYTLVSPYDGIVGKIRAPGSVLEAFPPELTPEHFVFPFEDTTETIQRSEQTSIARIFREYTSADHALSSRAQKIQKALNDYGLKYRTSDIPPWDSYDLPPEQRWAARRVSQAYRTSKINRTAEWLRIHADVVLKEFNSDNNNSEIKSIWQRANLGLSRAISDTDLIRATKQVLSYYAHTNNVTVYAIIRDPYTGDSFEPNNPELIGKDGVLRITTPRSMDFGDVFPPPDRQLSFLIEYWKEALESGLQDPNDKIFLNYLAKPNKPFSVNNTDRLNVAQAIINESNAAIKSIQKAAILSQLIAIASTFVKYKDLEDIRSILQNLISNGGETFKHAGITTSDIDELTKKISFTLPSAPTKETPSYLSPTKPSAYSIARVANELRTPQIGGGTYVVASEREGLIKMNEDGQSFNYNMRFWTLDVPLGGNSDDGKYTRLVNPESTDFEYQRFSDIEELYDIEVRVALALSPVFSDLTRGNTMDLLASTLREFEYRKSEAGRQIRRVADRLRTEWRQTEKLISERDALERFGYFFAAEPSVVVRTFVSESDAVSAGTPIAVVRPTTRFRADFKVDSLNHDFYPGAKIKSRLTCPQASSQSPSIPQQDAELVIKEIFPSAEGDTQHWNLVGEIKFLTKTSIADSAGFIPYSICTLSI